MSEVIPPSIACMVLYKNERHHLQRIVPKILEIFDQAIFVTNLEPSTDGSDELLAEFGITPARMQWVEDFSAARQFGLNLSTCDYTMWMDCDDDLVTGCADWQEARTLVKEFLASSQSTFFMHRVYHEDRTDFWPRENWFHRRAKVRVKYPTHEVYMCEGSFEEFPGGLVDRVNDSLVPDYSGKLWRYFDMLYGYVRDVDPDDARCRFFMAREFDGPPRAHVALYLDYFRAARRPSSPLVFADECWASYNLLELRPHTTPSILEDNARVLLKRYPFEFMAHTLFALTFCETRPGLESANHLYHLLQHRLEFDRDPSPFTKGWYFDKALNCAGYYLHHISIELRSLDLAKKSVEMLTLADNTHCSPDIADLVHTNRRAAELWLNSLAG